MKAQPKTSNIIKSLLGNLREGINLSDWDAAKIRKEIKDLPDLIGQNLAYGLYYTCDSKQDKSISYFEKAINTNNSPMQAYTIYYYAMSCMNMHHTSCIRCYEFSSITNSPFLYNNALSNSTLLLDLDMYDDCIGKLKKMKKLDDTPNANQSIVEMACLKAFAKRNNIDTSSLKMIGDIALTTVQEFGFALPGNKISQKKERSYLSIDYLITSSSCTANEISDLNYAFIEKMIENDLDILPVLVSFNRVSTECSKPKINDGLLKHVS